MTKLQLKSITADDFILKEYAWTKKSHYAVMEDGVLVRYDGWKTGFPIYVCLFEGYFEVSDACGVGYGSIASAKPISTQGAREIIRKEAKPRCTRPLERNNWLTC